MKTPSSPLQNIQTITHLAHAGRGDTHAGAVNPPLVRASTILFPNVAALKNTKGRGTYGRHGTATAMALEDALCAAEGADACILTPSGLSATTTTLLTLLAPGDHLLMTDSAYEPTSLFCNGLLKRLGIETTFYDPLIGANIAELIRPNTRVVYVESPGSLTFEMQDIPLIATIAHQHGAYVVSDSTWATPIGWRAFELGIDVSIHAATKYIVGHADAFMGAILCKEALHARLRDTYRALGLAASPDDAYLTLRGLRTLAARLAMHKQHALTIAQWLEAQPEVARVLYPPLPSAPDHALWARDFHPDYASGLMGVVFSGNIQSAQMNTLVDSLQLFGIGYSWGGYESLILPVHPATQRRVTSNRWQNTAMMRLHVGLESPNDLIADLTQGFIALRS